MERSPDIFALHEECVRLCRELKACLDEEWACLIALRPEGLTKTNHRKEGLTAALAMKKARLKLLLESEAGSPEVSARLESMRAEWCDAWEPLIWRCEENQRFLRHSVRNMECCLENLNRLMGRASLYSAKGKRVDLASPGKVVTRQY